MSIRKATIVNYIDFAKGVDNTSPLGSPQTKNTLSNAQNVDLVTTTLLKKRNGSALVATWGTRKIRQGFEYVKIDDTRETLVYGHDAAVTGTSGIFAKLDSGGAFTNLKTGLTDGVKPVIVQFNSLTFVFNGVDDFLYDGTTTRQIGITEPSIAPTFNSFVAGSLNTSSSYIYTYTYYNTVTGAESTPAPYSSPITTGVNNGIKINVTPGSATTADKIVIYRSVGGGTELQFEAEIAISSTTYNSINADSALGDVLELDNSRPALGKYATKADNRIFLAGFADNTNRVYYSKIGLAGPMPESFQALDFVDCNPNEGDKIKGISVVGGTVIVFKERSYGKLIRIDSSFGGLELTGSTKYLYQEMSKNVTFLDNSLIISLDSILFWLGLDDVYSTDGTNTTSQGLRIQNTIKQVNLSQSANFTAISKLDTKQIIFSVALGSDLEPNYQIVGHYNTFPQIGWTFYTPGANVVTHPGLPMGALFTVTIDATQRKIYYFGSTDGSGKIYQLDTGTSDDGLGIYFKVQLAWEMDPSFVVEKVYHSAYLLIAGASTAHLLTHTFQLNGVDIDVMTRTTPLASFGSGWGYVNWGAFNWSVVGFNPVKVFPRKRGRIGRYSFLNINADEPAAIQSLSTVYQLQAIN